MEKFNKNILLGADIFNYSIIPVMAPDPADTVKDTYLPSILPALILNNSVVFPGTVIPVMVSDSRSIKLIKEASGKDMLVGAFPLASDAEDLSLTRSNFPGMGTVSKVLKTIEMPDGSITAILHGIKRVSFMDIVAWEPYYKVSVIYLDEYNSETSDRRLSTLADLLKEQAVQLIGVTDFAAKDIINALRGISDFSFLVNILAASLSAISMEDKIELLAVSDLKERGMKLLGVLDRQMDLLRLKQEINSKVKSEMDQQQREYYLNSQLRTIQEELGMMDGDDITRLHDQAQKKKWGKTMAALFDRELAKLERFNPSSPEYSIQYNFLQYLVELPWAEYTKDNLDLAHARKVLDNDHYGLEKVKERIIEYLAVLKLKGDMKSPILCLYGPPGVGKTSLGKSVAKALGRKYVRISLGGVHDEAEIRGHRKTYIGALPGRIISAVHKAGSSNPVIVLDEIDKVGADYKGDPSSALLEALDPEQNTAFHDNYLDVDYDLSKILFITTANTTQTIQPALLDRMELIDVSGYLQEEKLAIAKKFLLPKQIKEHGLKKPQLKISDDALNKIIEEYTHESGVRGLEKQIAKIARVTARKLATEEDRPSKILPEHLKEYLGLPTASHDKQKGNEMPGVVTGLAWTSMGGEILFIESSVSEGKGVLSTTGNLGEVMKESATIAWQYIKAHPDLAGITVADFMKKDIHLHVPEGAVPKDGPSAGITMVSSMISALRGQAVKHGIAMTGEMTLRGRVLPVGGIKEKILAAKRAGVDTIFISSENKKDVEDIKEIYVKGLTFVYVDTIDDVIKGIF